MRTLSDKSGYDGYSEIRSEVGTSQSTSTAKLFYKNLIRQANSVSLVIILRHYGYRVDAQNRKLICPFTKHSGGRENTPSFQYYPDTNTFWCFGCKTGRGPVDFVANKEGITITRAASKIIELFASDVSVDGLEIDHTVNYSERLEILMEFSNFVREFIRSNQNDPIALTYIENVAFSFDKMNEKHTLDNNALKLFMLELKTKVN